MKATRLLAIALAAFVVALFLPWKRYCAGTDCLTTVGWASGFPGLLFWAGVAALGSIVSLDLSRRSTPLWGRGAGYFAVAVGIFTGAHLESTLLQEQQELDLLAWSAYVILALGGVVAVLGVIVLGGGWGKTGNTVTTAIRKLRTWRFGSADPPSS